MPIHALGHGYIFPHSSDFTIYEWYPKKLWPMFKANETIEIAIWVTPNII